MKTYSSSTIKLFNSHCPAALGFYERGTPIDTSQTAYGVADHAVLEAIGNYKDLPKEHYQRVADAVCEKLITEGRTFRGRHEPPMAPDHAFLGRDVALRWLEFNELPEGAQYEIELRLPLQDFVVVALHDCIWIEDHSDESGERIVAVTRDWKGWQGTIDELETIQRKAQAVTLWAWHNMPVFKNKPVDEIRLEICNLQTHQIFSKTIVLDEEGLELINQWARDLNMVCHAVDRTREARPGVGCLSCPYNYVCDHRITIRPDDQEELETLANYLVYLETERNHAIDRLKAVQELPVQIEGGYVGWKLHPDNKVKEKANHKICDAWFEEKKDIDMVRIISVKSLLASMNLGLANIKEVANTLYGKDDAMAEDFLDSCIEKHKGRRFGVWKEK